MDLKNSSDVYKAIVASTAHLSPSDVKMFIMQSGYSTTDIGELAYGFAVRMRSLDSGVPMADGHIYHQLSEGARNLIKDAHAAGFSLVEFDRDGTVYDGYPVHDD